MSMIQSADLITCCGQGFDLPCELPDRVLILGEGHLRPVLPES
jgi:hypothetical protein